MVTLLSTVCAQLPSYLVTSCSDSTLALWNLDPGPRQFSMIHRFSTPYAQTALSYVTPYSMLYSGSAVGLIHSWDLHHGYETSCLTGHSDVVMDLLCIPSVCELVSCSMDTTVRIWDTCSGVQRQVRLRRMRAECPRTPRAQPPFPL